MLNLIKKIMLKRAGLREYPVLLGELIKDGDLSEDSKEKLKKLAEEYELKDSDLKQFHIMAVRHVLKYASDDRRLTKDEIANVENVAEYFGLTKEDLQIDQKEVTKFSQLHLIENGELPDISSVAPEGNLQLDEGEILHHIEPGQLTKLKKVTERYNYSGFTGSIRITKGLRYRTGSVKVGGVQKDVLTEEDSGFFWVSNKGVGYKGIRKHFFVDYKKIASFEVGQLGLSIFKDGKENPYMLKLDDYEVSCALVSYYLNQK